MKGTWKRRAAVIASKTRKAGAALIGAALLGGLPALASERQIIPFELDDNSHMIIEMEVNGSARVEGVIDTAATFPMIDGETARSAEVNAKLAAGVPAALAVMLLALTFQFNSARRVLLTFLTIPLVLIGAPLALLATGQPLSFFAILGLISLAGIIINNAIVLIDQIDADRQSMVLKEAIVSAAQKRVTPIMLTSLTTIFGLIPMALAGGALFEPMATLMIGGLAVASVMTLFFVPSGYYLLFRGR